MEEAPAVIAGGEWERRNGAKDDVGKTVRVWRQAKVLALSDSDTGPHLASPYAWFGGRIVCWNKQGCIVKYDGDHANPTEWQVGETLELRISAAASNVDVTLRSMNRVDSVLIRIPLPPRTDDLQRAIQWTVAQPPPMEKLCLFIAGEEEAADNTKLAHLVESGTALDIFSMEVVDVFADLQFVCIKTGEPLPQEPSNGSGVLNHSQVPVVVGEPGTEICIKGACNFGTPVFLVLSLSGVVVAAVHVPPQKKDVMFGNETNGFLLVSPYACICGKCGCSTQLGKVEIQAYRPTDMQAAATDVLQAIPPSVFHDEHQESPPMVTLQDNWREGDLARADIRRPRVDRAPIDTAVIAAQIIAPTN